MNNKNLLLCIDTNQFKLLQYIYNYQREHLTSPSIEEQREFMDYKSSNSITQLHKGLVKLEMIEKSHGKARSIKILEKGIKTIDVYQK